MLIPDPESRKGGTRTVLIVLGLVLLALVAGVFDGTDSDGEPTEPVDTQGVAVQPQSGVDRYLDEYGGSESVYRQILNSSDCAYLQSQFDTAANNNDREEPGTPLFRATLGYMTAADDRLEAAGCYG